MPREECFLLMWDDSVSYIELWWHLKHIYFFTITWKHNYISNLPNTNLGKRSLESFLDLLELPTLEIYSCECSNTNAIMEFVLFKTPFTPVYVIVKYIICHFHNKIRDLPLTIKFEK